MSKIIINGKISSEYQNEKLECVKAILKDNQISYVKNGINVSIMILKDKIILKRESKDIKLNLEFEENKTLTTYYVIKDLGIKIKVDTKTRKLLIGNNFFEIEYDLFMNEELSGTFNFKLEWSDF